MFAIQSEITRQSVLQENMNFKSRKNTLVETHSELINEIMHNNIKI